MRLLTRSRINEFCTKHSDSTNALSLWYTIVVKKNWKDLNDLKTDFPSVDYISPNMYCFNIKGNHYRLIAKINFQRAVVRIIFVGTHAEYSKIDISKLRDY